MKHLLILSTILFASAVTYSQTVTDCPHPSGCVVMSREATVKLLQADDRVKALEAEVAALKDAVAKHKDIETDLKVEVAKVMGENTALRQNDVSNRAIITAMIPMLRQKVVGIKIF